MVDIDNEKLEELKKLLSPSIYPKIVKDESTGKTTCVCSDCGQVYGELVHKKFLFFEWDEWKWF